MKSKLWIFVFLLFAFHSYAQSGPDIVASWWKGSDATFYRISLSNNEFHNIDTLAEVHSVALGEACYDPQQGHYFRLTNLGITVVDVKSGRIIEAIPNTLHLNGLEYDPIAKRLLGTRWTGEVEMLASVDIESGQSSDIALLSGVKGISMGESTFDMENQVYFSNTNQGITIIDAVTGRILDSIRGQLMGIEYDPASNSLVGISWNGLLARLTTLDLRTKTFTVVKDLPELKGMALGETSYDPDGRRYIMTTGHNIAIIDAVSGNILDTIPNTNHTNGLECAYSRHFFKGRDNGISCHVYPNPSKGNVNIEFDKPLQDGSIFIQSLDGKTVYKASHISGRTYSDDFSALPVGMYSIIIRVKEMTAFSKLMKY